MEMKKILSVAKKASSTLLSITVIFGVMHCAKNANDIKDILLNSDQVQTINSESVDNESIQKLNVENLQNELIEPEKNSINADRKPKDENNSKLSKQSTPQSQSKPNLEKKTVKKSETVYITKTGECYHKSWCKHLRQSKIAIGKKKVQMKYRPCKDFRP